MRCRDQLVFAFPPHFKIQLHRLRTKSPNINTDFQKIVQCRHATKVTLEMHARQPDLQLVKHLAVSQADFAKQLSLGKLEEVNVSAVKNNARRVDIAPADTLFNRKRLVL